MGQEGPWWFSVKYGEDMTQLFNMDCWACTLVNHVRREPHAQACLACCQQARDTTCALRRLTATAGTAAAQIKDKCGYEKIPEPVDLQKEGGGMVELHTAGRTSAKDILEPKATYILCKMAVPEDAPEGTAPAPEMLWTPPEGYEAPAGACLLHRLHLRLLHHLLHSVGQRQNRTASLGHRLRRPRLYRHSCSLPSPPPSLSSPRSLCLITSAEPPAGGAAKKK